MLINHGSFSILMELGYMMTVTSILSSQRLKYYQYLNQGAFGSISGAFSFSFKQNEEEYINDYRTRLKDRDMIYLNCQEEYDALQNWVQQFS